MKKRWTGHGKATGRSADLLLSLWIDGSFQPHRKDAAGGAVFRTDAAGHKIDVLAFRFDSASRRFPIEESRDAERLTVMHALEAMEPNTIGRLASDCIEVIPRLEDIQRGRLNHGKYNGELFERLTTGVLRQPHMTVAHVRRSERGIPVANAFAQAAALGDIARMEAQARRYHVPFTFIDDAVEKYRYAPPVLSGH